MKDDRQTKLSVSKTRWLAYATAGAATAVGTATEVQAEIHYSGEVDVQVFRTEVVQFPLSRGASLTFFLTGVGSYPEAAFNLRGGLFGSGRIYRTTDLVGAPLSNLGRGRHVSNGHFKSVAENAYGLIHGLYGTGQFMKSGNAFIGYRFDVGSGTQYGWVRLRIRQDPQDSGHYGFVVEEYAWGDPGDPILTGQTSSAPNEAVAPVKGSLGFLALGSAGLEAWRAARPDGAGR